MQSPLLNYIYPNPCDIYLKSLESTSRSTARATFVFGDNPRTSDYTHVGAAEMLAGISQATYCLTNRYAPGLVKDDTISNCFFDKVTVRFSKMLAPQSEAFLDIEIEQPSRGELPTFNFDGFVTGSVSCAMNSKFIAPKITAKSRIKRELSESASHTLRYFYNNGSDITLKEISKSSSDCWQAKSSFEIDRRLRSCRYTTTTQVIVALSQLAFAVVGDTVGGCSNNIDWPADEFLNSMSDQALIKLFYTRPLNKSLDFNLAARLASSKNVRGCKFIRLGLDGDITGTMDNMLSPRIPIKSVRV